MQKTGFYVSESVSKVHDAPFLGLLHRFSSSIFFIGLRGVNGTFLLYGLRTEFKRIWPYGHWASAFAFQL